MCLWSSPTHNAGKVIHFILYPGKKRKVYRNLSPVVGFASVHNTALCETEVLREIGNSVNRGYCEVASDTE